jgi:polyphenol oxidase
MVYQLEPLRRLPGLVHGFSRVADGNMAFTWGEAKTVVGNRRRFLAQMDVPIERCVTAFIDHSIVVEQVGKGAAGRGMTEPTEVVADALITNTPDLFLFFLTGDCLPIILYDSKGPAIGLVHASRLNSASGFVKKVVAAMGERYGSEPSDLMAGVGPAIHKESYVFPASEVRRWGAGFGDFAIDLGDGRMAVDLIGYSRGELIAAGVPAERIAVSDIDVGVDASFFSHRRSKRTGEPEGRMATVLGLRYTGSHGTASF